MDEQNITVEKIKAGILGALCALLLSSVIIAAMAVVKNVQNKTPVAEPSNVSAAQTTPSTSQTQQDTKESGDDWKLLLINQENPLPDDYKTTATQLKNGQAVDERIYPELQKMMDDARAAGLKPLICSSYRTSEKQKQLFDKKVEQYKQEGTAESEAVKQASAWVAPPGTSEHEAGLAVDIVDMDNQQLNETQEQTPTYKWLKENCAKYGFILRYPPEKSEITNVNYEPWHFRYVGKEHAEKIMSQGICLEEYIEQIK